MVNKDVCVISDKYTNKSGKEVNKYQNVGVAFVHSDGKTSIKLSKWFNPAGINGDCYLYLFDRKENTNQVETNDSSQEDPPF